MLLGSLSMFLLLVVRLDSHVPR